MLTGGRRKEALLGDAMEAIIAAVYQDERFTLFDIVTGILKIPDVDVSSRLTRLTGRVKMTFFNEEPDTTPAPTAPTAPPAVPPPAPSPPPSR